MATESALKACIPPPANAADVLAFFYEDQAAFLKGEKGDDQNDVLLGAYV